MINLHGIKVISSSEMARVEKLSFALGPGKDEKFMVKAGYEIANAVENYVLKHQLEKKCLLLIGKGNNGGDAYVCGIELIKKGFDVEALLSFPIEYCSSLNQKKGKAFLEHGGKFAHGAKNGLFSDEYIFPKKGVILDGLLGTGFSGELKEPLLPLVKRVNKLTVPVLAIDIPSGVDGNTGEVKSDAIEADLTIFLGMAKKGFFLSSGYNFVKQLYRIDFGLESEFIDQANEDFFLFDESIVKDLLPKISFNRHKYQAGYVLAIAGSSSMRGAACLSSLAALRAGSGMVRLFVPENLKMHLPVEVVCSDRSVALVLQEIKRAKAMYIGPGLGREEETKDFLKGVLSKISIPLVLDADALYLIGKNPEIFLPVNSILTPHRKEMATLLHQEKVDDDEELFFSKCQKYVEEKKVIIVLKGAPTFIFHPELKPLIISKGDPGMATAGTGDVLTGMIASFLSQGLTPLNAACLGVYLHGLCGQIASKEKTAYGLIASDLLDVLPSAFEFVIGSNN